MGYYCNKCKKEIDNEVYAYSIKKYHRILCINCQKGSLKEKVSEPTPLSNKLYLALKKQGVPAKLEKYDGYKHIDIAVPEAKVNIEVDGGHHNFDHKQALSDLKRTYYSFKKGGYLTLRIPNSLLENHFDETVNYIVRFLNESNEQMEEDDDIFSWF